MRAGRHAAVAVAAFTAGAFAQHAFWPRATRAISGRDGQDEVEQRIQRAVDAALTRRRGVAVALVSATRSPGAADTQPLLPWATRTLGALHPAPALLDVIGNHLVIVREGSDAEHASSALLHDVALLGGQSSASGLRLRAGMAKAPRDGVRSAQLVSAAATALFDGRGNGDGVSLVRSPERPASEDVDDAGSAAVAGPGRRTRTRPGPTLGVAIGDLEVAFQPKVSLDDLELAGAEALVRWPRDARGRLTATEIITRCTEHGEITALTDHVLDVTAAFGAQLQADGGSGLPLSVNLAAADLEDAHLHDRIDRALSRHGLSPEHLVVEITENQLLSDEIERQATLGHLRQLGVAVSIDDFGTGYSSLSHIRRFEVQEIKIDTSFVDRVAFEPMDAVIVRAISDMGHGLGLRVVAEGVESSEAWGVLRDFGVDVVQGHNVARAMHAGDFLAWRSSWPVSRRPRGDWQTAGPASPQPAG